jgi:hypothetical protein
VQGPLAQIKHLPASATHSLGQDVLVVDMTKLQPELQ